MTRAGAIWRVAVYPILFPAAYVLEYALANEVQPGGFIRPLLVAVIGATVVFLLAWAATRDHWVGGLLSTLLLVFVASRLWLLNLLGWLSTLGTDVQVPAFGALVAVAAISLIFIGRWIRRQGLAMFARRITPALNLIVAISLLVVVAPALSGVSGWRTGGPQRHSDDAVPPADPPPNIYLILLDGYPRADLLLEHYGIDNSLFIDALADRGFRVRRDSLSNYTYTDLALPSLLQMNYVSVPGGSISVKSLRRQFHHTVDQSAGLEALNEAGFITVANAEGYEHVTLRNAVHRFLDRPELTDFESVLLFRTWIPDLAPVVPDDLLLAERRRRISGALRDAAALASEARDVPLFALFHIPSPHVPIVFGKSGGPVPWTSRQYFAEDAEQLGMSDPEFHGAFGSQLEHLNSLILETVDAVLGADPNAVIVLFSDHGSSPRQWPVRERSVLLPNLLAVRTPYPAPEIDKVRTPVNLLRGLLNQYTGASLPYLPDRFFTATVEEGVMLVLEASPPPAGH